jgi:hypothetical protein
MAATNIPDSVFAALEDAIYEIAGSSHCVLGEAHDLLWKAMEARNRAHYDKEQEKNDAAGAAAEGGSSS